MNNSEIRKYIVGNCRRGDIPSGEGTGMFTLIIKDDGRFEWIVTRGGFLSRTVGLINGGDNIIGD